ncbi:hypothetical protein DXG03_003284 [Asterophora parasitica]|uniref:Rhodanese domain-containing protein n=1 Tax=Asterophora parasitica TaxID=117018 RepID=A0A9P7G9I1_9AGAR|nr:hypothetical protein DXG03_003284 [Asterophora parasitica]
MKSDKIPGKDFIVVDVRDDDYPGGNVKGSLNKPSNGFLTSVDDLVKDTKDVPLIYDETRKEVLKNGDIPHEVAVLRGGFTQFQAKFKDDPTLVENWDKEVWEQEWSGH